MVDGSSEILILNLKEALGILDLRLLGHYKARSAITKHRQIL